ncbi:MULTISPECIES: TDT family transporter [Virgibacillus]|uniref:Voltage-dependent anion channel n=1 Tax=Virgibacillus kapii TaxID=1638645 RepID=A0ABQ2DLV8_9BACI|nr:MULTISPECIES: hypothetical protein [Virgibacillus]EQB34700.1 hypothetical protein M948_20140 [Virgibacillus sp. CM-4]MYL43644.1 hypothetical protein [Virgibacillus massiliensis]GGJ63403.1 hypothetical protein GCM10007111_26730 [Virgibacillus kapii]
MASKNIIINPSSGAIIMALGIFLFVTIDAFPFLENIKLFFVFIFLYIGMLIYTLITIQLFHKDFLISLLINPVNSFVIGTWIAGISVLSNVIMKYLPEFHRFVQGIVCVNTLLWLGFLLICLYNFKRLYKKSQKYPVHGIILLSTVATQSMVLSWLPFFQQIPIKLIKIIIMIGLLFYGLGILLIIFRYSRNNWSLLDDWTNTNCIIHGALSITGLAIVSSHLLSADLILIFWLLVFILFLLVESIEIVRGIKRVSNLGWKKGIFTYNVSQWSRNFTFGMFYAFTFKIHSNIDYKSTLESLHEIILSFWNWTVLLILVIEIGIWFRSYFIDRNKITEKASI